MIQANYRPLKLTPVSHDNCYVPSALKLSSVKIDSPALQVMTDLAKIPAATISSASTLTQANQAMIHRGVRMLFVVDATQHLMGVITATDLLGEKPVQVAQNRGVHRDELLVEQLMTPVEAMEAVSMIDVTRADVGHIVATLKHSGRQHAIAVENDSAGRQVLRGIFSASQIARQLGVQLGTTTEIARTFAEIEAVIAAV